MAEGTAGNILFGTPAVDMGNYGWVIYLYLLILTASITAALRVGWVFYLCIFYLIPLPLWLIKMRTSFGRQTSLWIGVALLTLGVGSFGVGFARAYTYALTDAMSAVLMFSAVPLIPWGIFITLVPFRRRLAIVAYSVVFVLITPTIGLLMYRLS